MIHFGYDRRKEKVMEWKEVDKLHTFVTDWCVIHLDARPLHFVMFDATMIPTGEHVRRIMFHSGYDKDGDDGIRDVYCGSVEPLERAKKYAEWYTSFDRREPWQKR
jgi:hypothetical protein